MVLVIFPFNRFYFVQRYSKQDVKESSFLKKKKKTIEAELIYNVVLMSLAQQSDSVIHTHIYICVCVCIHILFHILFH